MVCCRTDFLPPAFGLQIPEPFMMPSGRGDPEATGVPAVRVKPACPGLIDISLQFRAVMVMWITLLDPGHATSLTKCP
jgi:hypothetical protein